MRDLPLGPFLRLKGAIEQAANSISEESAAVSGIALPQAYKRFRSEALELVPDEDKEELSRICPEWTTPLGGSHAGMKSAEFYTEARVLLLGLAGFLNGYVLETQIRVEAEEKARLAAEEGGQYL